MKHFFYGSLWKAQKEFIKPPNEGVEPNLIQAQLRGAKVNSLNFNLLFINKSKQYFKTFFFLFLQNPKL